MTQIPAGAIVLVPGEAKSVEIGGATVSILARGDETGNAFSLVETVETVQGFGPPLHVHRDAAESFVVLEGEYSMHLDGHDVRCPPGSFIYVPRGMPHSFTAAAGSRKLNIFTPAAMVGYFEELAEAIRAGTGEEMLNEIAERYSMTVLGPRRSRAISRPGPQVET